MHYGGVPGFRNGALLCFYRLELLPTSSDANHCNTLVITYCPCHHYYHHADETLQYNIIIYAVQALQMPSSRCPHPAASLIFTTVSLSYRALVIIIVIMQRYTISLFLPCARCRCQAAAAGHVEH